MAAINFPASPTNGQTFTADNKTFVYDSAKTVWKITSTGGAAAGESTITVSQNSANEIVSNTLNFINTSTVTVETSNNSGIVNVAFTSTGTGITTGKAIAMSIVFGG